eukprot:TRINITY_DN8097_c0_g1_i3.p1 TRINITY_DN8097_c0_g1~~TRINITY_DN8097_c0_g1_i3.p1  ORF type:complete len:591 (-),score=16.78 TRINITY_DN8097_c0_g1_i3:32-1804(-)
MRTSLKHPYRELASPLKKLASKKLITDVRLIDFMITEGPALVCLINDRTLLKVDLSNIGGTRLLSKRVKILPFRVRCLIKWLNPLNFGVLSHEGVVYILDIDQFEIRKEFSTSTRDMATPLHLTRKTSSRVQLIGEYILLEMSKAFTRHRCRVDPSLVAVPHFENDDLLLNTFDQEKRTQTIHVRKYLMSKQSILYTRRRGIECERIVDAKKGLIVLKNPMSVMLFNQSARKEVKKLDYGKSQCPHCFFMGEHFLVIPGYNLTAINLLNGNIQTLCRIRELRYWSEQTDCLFHIKGSQSRNEYHICLYNSDTQEISLVSLQKSPENEILTQSSSHKFPLRFENDKANCLVNFEYNNKTSRGVAYSENGNLVVYDLKGMKLVEEIPTMFGSSVKRAVFCSDGSYLMLFKDYGLVELLDVELRAKGMRMCNLLFRVTHSGLIKAADYSKHLKAFAFVDTAMYMLCVYRILDSDGGCDVLLKAPFSGRRSVDSMRFVKNTLVISYDSEYNQVYWFKDIEAGPIGQELTEITRKEMRNLGSTAKLQFSGPMLLTAKSDYGLQVWSIQSPRSVGCVKRESIGLENSSRLCRQETV